MNLSRIERVAIDIGGEREGLSGICYLCLRRGALQKAQHVFAVDGPQGRRHRPRHLARRAAAMLVIPVDTHVAAIARRYKLTGRKSIDWRMAEEITATLKK